MVTFLKKGRALPRSPNGLPAGPILSLKDLASLERAPRKRPPGTTMTVRSYNIPGVPGDDEHMYTEYDDGHEQYIYRAGPRNGRLFARVDEAKASPDFGKGKRVLFQKQLPNTSARAAKAAAEGDRDIINAQRRPYLGIISNSNFANADHVERRTGYRVGDAGTPGWKPDPILLVPSPFDPPPLFPVMAPGPYRRPPR